MLKCILQKYTFFNTKIKQKHMDPISNLLTNRADDLFKPPAPINSNEDVIINLEPQSEPQIIYTPNDDNIVGSTIQSNDDVLFQEEVLIDNQPIMSEIAQIPKIEKNPIENNASNIDLTKLKTMIHSMRDQLDAMLRFINGEDISLSNMITNGIEAISTGEVIVEGIFNGEKMIDSSGKEYAVPPNYASKSKLVEGDKMKLTITPSGKFIYKQIMQIERKRLVGELLFNSANGQWSVTVDGKNYKVLTASVTFYKGIFGDEVVFFVPRNIDCYWGAIEHIIHKK